MLYQLLIGPLKLLYELIYRGCVELLHNHGWCIVLLSIVMNLLLLPLYRRADAIQDMERKQEKDLSAVVSHIKKTFRGDERFMMLQTYYRQNNYKPYYVLKGFMPLMLEIPFFIAAYDFLSHYSPLTGAVFGPIRDLGSPDHLLKIGENTLNALPILMTLINCVSSAIYTRGFPLKDKLQLYGMALLFLILLYDSPAGLVVYWTLNNLFSLVKNIVTGLVSRRAARKQRKTRAPKAVRKPSAGLFVCGCVFLAVLTGMLIPSAVIVSSPLEFIRVENYYSPLRHVLNASLLSFGFFVIWLGVFYYMFKDRGKRVMSAIVWVLSGIFIVNYMFFIPETGLLSIELCFEEGLMSTVEMIILNLAVLVVLTLLMVLVFRKKERIALWMTVLMAVSVLGMSVYNISQINTALADYRQTGQRDTDNERAHFTLSKNGNNVVIIMLDRAVNRYLPYIMEEHPELKEQLKGFVYYPNTVSFGGYTNFCTPSLFGGYEYTPWQLNARSDMLLEDKQNEALKVLPLLFRNAGYRVTVCDPPYAGYSWVPDISIYDGEEGITAYLTESGQFASNTGEVLDQIWQRNFFCYSIVKCSPLALQPALYDSGYYCEANYSHTAFDYSYAVLKSLPEMTRFSDGDENTFLLLSNSTTHEPVILSADLEPATHWSYSVNDEQDLIRRDAKGNEIVLRSETIRKHYAINEAALVQVGRWLQALQDAGVYDNTRIIIASDHGINLGQFEELMFSVDGTQVDAMFFNPLFLVKDFGATKELEPKDDFMTNADAPALLVQGLIPEPVLNPITGNPIAVEKYEEKKTPHITTSRAFSVTNNNGTAFFPSLWLSVHDDILDPANWAVLGEW